jgi:hypothetical protein
MRLLGKIYPIIICIIFLCTEEQRHGNDEFEVLFAREAGDRLWHKNEKINCEVTVSMGFLRFYGRDNLAHHHQKPHY